MEMVEDITESDYHTILRRPASLIDVARASSTHNKTNQRRKSVNETLPISLPSKTQHIVAFKILGKEGSMKIFYAANEADRKQWFDTLTKAIEVYRKRCSLYRIRKVIETAQSEIPPIMLVSNTVHCCIVFGKALFIIPKKLT
jgi:hypothetical protein